MATFDNVTYTYYSDTLGRSVVPSAEDFNSFKLVNIQIVKKLLPYIEELEESGIDKAVCLMIEADYKTSLLLNGKTAGSINSETLGGHSVSYGGSQLTKQIDLDAKSLDAQKMECIKLFNRLNIGVR